MLVAPESWSLFMDMLMAPDMISILEHASCSYHMHYIMVSIFGFAIVFFLSRVLNHSPVSIPGHVRGSSHVH